MINSAWKTDNYKFVGKSFDVSYANRINKLSPIVGEVNAKSIDYMLTGSGGYGELQPYVGRSQVEGTMHRAFNTIITPEEYTLQIPVDYKAAKIDKLGETRKVGTKLGDSAAMTVYMHVLRMFAGAFDGAKLGGDGKPWASTEHPVASLGSSGRTFTPDPDAGIYSNLGTDSFSVSAITDAQAAANRFVTPDGLPFLCEYDTVLVSPELESKAKQFFGENAKLLPGTDYNDANPVGDMKYIVIGGGKDGFSAGQWAVCDRKLMKEIVNIVYNTRPTVMQTELDNPLVDMYTAYVDFAAGWGDARQIFFNDPS